MKPAPYNYYNKPIPAFPLKNGVFLARYSDIQYGPMELHAWQNYELIFIISGIISIRTESEIFPAMPGALVLHPPLQNHCTSVPPATHNYHRFVIQVEPRLFEKALADFAAERKTSGDLADKVVYQMDSNMIPIMLEFFNQLETNQASEDEFTETSILHILRQMFVTVERFTRQRKDQKEESTSVLALLADEYVQKSYFDPLLSLDTIANRLYTNKCYLARVYRDHFGKTLYQTILDKRLSKALEYIGKGYTVKKAYLEVGFKDYSSFLKAFKKKYNCLPTEYFDQVEQAQKEQAEKEQGAAV